MEPKTSRIEQILKVPIFFRTIHLVVNIPTPLNPQDSAPTQVAQKVSLRARTWRILKTFGPVAASIVAITISVLTLQEQRQFDETAALAGQRQEAERVSFLQESSSTGSTASGSVLIENLSSSPANSVILVTEVTNSKGEVVSPVQILEFSIASIPACSSGTLDISPLVPLALAKLDKKTSGNGDSALVYAMDFLQDGLSWQYNGQLVQLASNIRAALVITEGLHISFNPTTACS
jgi:hypothetical protein